ncbi:AAA family ATPase [Marinobacterium jannaschii]|uniref:AAA family ATPase n=1 Tax=Marinobacterium jannaschii TaxID=64970 RepID=UPI000486862E|nr:AAA family ATPase [Marinobacterium jannaschii]
MGKIFEALYGSEPAETVEASAQDDFVLYQLAPEVDSAAAGSKPEAAGEPKPAADKAPRAVVLSGRVPNIARRLSKSVRGNEKWRRDMKKTATNIIVSADPDEQGGKVVMFTGMSNGVGTTTVVDEIGTLLASEYAYNRILILDFSPCKKGERSKTLLNLLAHDCQLDEFVAVHNDREVTRVKVGLTGDSQTDIRASRHLQEFVRQAQERYDWILMDVPPFTRMPLSDTLGRISDGVVLIVNSGVTRVPALNAIEEDMHQLGINLLGIVLNFRRYPIPSGLLRFF